MTRLLLITLLVLSSGPAYAEWVKVGSSESEGGITVYADPDTIRRKVDRVTMWELYDYKTVQIEAGMSISSFKKQSEYDCTEERTRMLSAMDFSGNMGKGNVVSSDSTEDKWEPVEPGSVTRGLWKIACSKK
jgi:hypothetical protein